ARSRGGRHAGKCQTDRDPRGQRLGTGSAARAKAREQAGYRICLADGGVDIRGAGGSPVQRKSRSRLHLVTGVRTTRSSVSFQAPFRLSAWDEALPASDYDIDTEEDVIEGNERTVYLRTATLLHLRTAGKVQILTIDPQELEK